MSWLRFFLLGDFGQQLDIHEQKDHLRAVSRSQSRARLAHGKKLSDLTVRVQTLERIVGRLGTLLVQRGVLTDPQLDALVDDAAAAAGDAAAPGDSPPTIDNGVR